MVLITEVENRQIAKPYLGGYRDRLTSLEYLNAASQTGPPRKRVQWENTRTREVQSVEIGETATQSFRDRSTQMWRKDHYVPNSSDEYVSPQKYETHEDMQKRLNLDFYARVMQRAYRAYRVLKAIRIYARNYRQKVEDCKKLENAKAEALRKRYEDEIRRQTYPQSRDDFDKLFSLIERWRASRLNKINVEMFAASRIAENCRILEKTTEMLRAVDKHRRCLVDEHRESKRIRFLTINCKPIKWNGYKAKPIEMTTLRTQKAREYKNIYDALATKKCSNDDRIELLSVLKYSLNNFHSCIPAENFIRLVNQEIGLLSTGVNSVWLNNLRDRISMTYLRFVSQAASCTCVTKNTTIFNSPDDLVEPLETKKLLCRSCMKIFPYRNFSAHVRMKKLSCCMSCSWLREQNIDKRHYGPYTFLLNGIRAEEQRRNCYSSLLYVIREPGIYHLVNNIWHGHSVISENNDIFELRLPRFNVGAEWSPWNCILLTRDESETHYYVKDFSSFYSKRLLHKIHLAHQIAKTHFRELISFERKFRLSSRYYMIQNRKDYEPLKSVP